VGAVRRCAVDRRVYRIPVADPGSCDLSVPEMPRGWDYIVDNNLMALEDENPGLLVRPDEYEPPPRGWEEEATIAYYARTDAELTARKGRGVLFQRPSTQPPRAGSPSSARSASGSRPPGSA